MGIDTESILIKFKTQEQINQVEKRQSLRYYFFLKEEGAEGYSHLRVVKLTKTGYHLYEFLVERNGCR